MSDAAKKLVNAILGYDGYEPDPKYPCEKCGFKVSWVGLFGYNGQQLCQVCLAEKA